jgi:hypothetical protein
VWRSVARLSVAVVCLAGFGWATAAPAFAAQGVTVQITELPGTFAAGGAPKTVTVVASKRSGDCIKVRWSLVLRVDGVRLDRVRVDRIEDNGSFPVTVQTEGDAARVTDRQLDPGTLCDDRTVTARYNVSFTGDAIDGGGGEVTFAPEARSVNGQLLDRTTVTRAVASAQASPAPSEDEDPAANVPTEEPSSAGTAAGGQVDANRTSDGSSVVRVGPIGLGVGAVLVLLGLGLLIKVRRRSRLTGRPGQREVWYGATARRRPTGREAWRGRASSEYDESPAPVTAPVGLSRRTTQRRRGRPRQTLTLPPMRR